MKIIRQRTFQEPIKEELKSLLDEPLIVHRHLPEDAARNLIVLVHGLGGSRYGRKSTWGNIPQFLFEDFPYLDVGIYEYRTLFKRLKIWWSINLKKEAEVFAGIIREAEDYENVILAGHSMGGLLCMAVLQYFYTSNQREYLDRIRALILMASPQTGSQRVPRFFSWFSKDFYALRPHGDFVTELNKTLNNVFLLDENVSAPDRIIVPTWAVLASSDFWVDELSARINLTDKNCLTVRASHTSVVKPKDKRAEHYGFIYKRIEKSLPASVAPSALIHAEPEKQRIYPFVGRKREVDELIHILKRGRQGQGAVLFIEGRAGMGKSWLLDELKSMVSQETELAETRFVTGRCYGSTSSMNPYQPFIDILSDPALGRDNSPNWLTVLIRETAPDWRNIGASIGNHIDTWHWSTPLQNKSGQYVQLILRIAKQPQLLVLIIEDAHWIDDTSCELLFRLVQALQHDRLVVLVSYRPEALDEMHQLRHTKHELISKNLAHEMLLDSLNKKDVELYLHRRFGENLHHRLSEWLMDLCGGVPLFLTHYLNLLEERAIIRREQERCVFNGELRRDLSGNWETDGALKKIPRPRSVEVVLKERIERLDKEDLEALQAGAVQGIHFTSYLVSALIKKEERDILPQLRGVVNKHHVIRFTHDELQSAQRTQMYSFIHALMQQAFYETLSLHERRLYHIKVARILQSQLTEDLQPSRRWILDLARHYELGGERLQAARHYYQAALSSFEDGALIESAKLCRRILHHLLPEIILSTDLRDQLRVRATHLFFISDWYTIGSRPDSKEQAPPEKFAEDAVAAAQRLGDRALITRAKYTLGLVLAHTQGPAARKPIFDEALEIAQEDGDHEMEFQLLCGLANTESYHSVATSLEIMHKADNFFKKHEEEEVFQTIALKRQYHHLAGSIGCGYLNQGNYGEAVEWLDRSIEGFKALNIDEDLLEILNYLSQVYMETGIFQRAEEKILESLEIIKERTEPISWRGYNRALLGKVYIEWSQLENSEELFHKAQQCIEEGWEETDINRNAFLVAIVMNYRTELLLSPLSKIGDFQAADKQIKDTLDEVKRSGLVSSRISALSLRSQLALMHQDSSSALSYSQEALELLRQHYMEAPTVRSEEILFHHFRALQAADQKTEALTILNEAYQTMLTKADSIRDETQRESFLERVPLSQKILSAAQQAGIGMVS